MGATGTALLIPILLAGVVLARADAGARDGLDLVPVEGARLIMGDAEGEPDEAPSEVDVPPFRMMRHEVTNRQFAAFVAARGHRTDPERRGFGYVWDRRWRRVPGAQWRHPSGPESSIAGRADHPVVQVSAQDATAFCRSHGLRLPSEEEWERAARGTDGRRFPLGRCAARAAERTRQLWHRGLLCGRCGRRSPSHRPCR